MRGTTGLRTDDRIGKSEYIECGSRNAEVGMIGLRISECGLRIGGARNRVNENEIINVERKAFYPSRAFLREPSFENLPSRTSGSNDRI